jgi:hypothetical protein
VRKPNAKSQAGRRNTSRNASRKNNAMAWRNRHEID